MSGTFGTRLVRASFNPSSSNQVDEIKSYFSVIADLLNDARDNSTDADAKRCYSLAITHLETACMFAVKGATS